METVITARGKSDTVFTGVRYKAGIITSGRTGPEAKEKAKPLIARLLEVLRSSDAGLDLDGLRTSFKIEPKRTYDRATGEQKFEGYTATYSTTVDGKDVAASLTLHDRITDIDGVCAESPEFMTARESDARKEAFKQAADAARASFESQCEAVGEDPAAYELTHWSVRDEERHSGKTLSIDPSTAGLGVNAVGADPGRAVVDMLVSLHFQRKLRPAG